MKPYQCLYFDTKKSLFFVFIDNNEKLHFSYWDQLIKFNKTSILPGEKFNADIANYKEENNNYRGYKINKFETEKNIKIKDVIIIKNRSISESELGRKINSEERSIVYINCNFENIELKNIIKHNDLAFFGCTFHENFRFMFSEVQGNIWFSNCRFSCHFSLKNSLIRGDIHLESTDFSGEGGASFRGTKANNIYLDLGVKGCNDLFWFNEMVVTGVVSIGGNFLSDIQFLRTQGGDITFEPRIGSIIVGRELFNYENSNKTNISSCLKIDGYNINSIEINDLSSEKIEIKKSTIKLVHIHNLATITDLIVQENKFETTFLHHCSIGRHLRVNDNVIGNAIDFTGTSVSQVTYFEDNKIPNKMSLNFHRFTTGRLLIYPPKSLYGNSKNSIFSPRTFSVLMKNNERNTGEQYCSLKHWLSDSGNLELEDVAFFHMRNYHSNNKFFHILLGGVFGWGVRLQNIAISSFILILLFALVYFTLEPNLSLSNSISLSIQAFISSFFGKWSDYDPGGIISAIVTLESIFGVFFITVFIGAYVRKLLR